MMGIPPGRLRRWPDPGRGRRFDNATGWPQALRSSASPRLVVGPMHFMTGVTANGLGVRRLDQAFEVACHTASGPTFRERWRTRWRRCWIRRHEHLPSKATPMPAPRPCCRALREPLLYNAMGSLATPSARRGEGPWPRSRDEGSWGAARVRGASAGYAACSGAGRPATPRDPHPRGRLGCWQFTLGSVARADRRCLVWWRPPVPGRASPG